MKPTTKKYDFESAPDIVTRDSLFAAHGVALDAELAKLSRDNNRFVDPEIQTRTAELERERQARNTAYAAMDEQLRREWTKDGFDRYLKGLAKAEQDTEAQILDHLKAVKELALERTRQAVLRRASERKFAGFLMERGELQHSNEWRLLPSLIHGKPIQLAPGLQSYKSILDLFLGLAGDL